MSLINGLQDISAIRFYKNGDELVFHATKSVHGGWGSKTFICAIDLEGKTTDIQYSYMTNLERLKVFV